MNFADLFCGAGGKSIGFEQAGFFPILAIDNDRYALETYANNRKDYKELKIINDNISDLSYDSKKIIKNLLNSVIIDLIIGGPPCQGFSNVNKQKILNDPRNKLYKKFIDFVNLIRPKIFVMENVSGIKKLKNEIIRDFLSIDYNSIFTILNSSDFGVPQNRYRAFFIGLRSDLNFDLKDILNNIEKLKVKKKFTLNETIGDLPVLKARRIKNSYDSEDEETGYDSIFYKYKNNTFRNMINFNEKCNFLYNHKTRYNNSRDIKIFELLPQGKDSLHDSIKHIMPYKNREHIFRDKYYKLSYNNVSRTITAHMQYDCNMYIHPTQARGLTPREAARIQTFPDNYIFKGPFTSWYRQIGNAVPCRLAYIIAKSIKDSGVFDGK
ncbi:MAG: DNA cytosine methyltransferase [Candidatus Absconditabacterales bacterium]|nr:DNA cytosine methyltransferase [Candidatus Absconditabacterales bacterium]